LFGKGGGKEVFVSDVGSDILLGAEFSGLGLGNEPFFELGSKNTFRRVKVVFVDIGHEGDELRECGGRKG